MHSTSKLLLKTHMQHTDCEEQQVNQVHQEFCSFPGPANMAVIWVQNKVKTFACETMQGILFEQS